MFKSIYNDIKGQFDYGNNVTRLILINTIVFVTLWVIYAGIALTTGPEYAIVQRKFLNFFMLPPTLMGILKKPWTIITHMFLHEGFFHFLFNMFVLHMFGRIFGDLLGDRRVFPLYILGGLLGIVFIQLAPVFGIAIGPALGASAAIMAFVVATAIVAPDSEVRLFIIGRVRIKYIALFFIVTDIIGVANLNNTGGHFGHIGGMVLGWLYILMINSGNDPAPWMNKTYDSFIELFRPKPKKKPKSPLTVKYRATVPSSKKSTKKAKMQKVSSQEKLDKILEKISMKGIGSLSKEEKAFLDNASKNN